MSLLHECPAEARGMPMMMIGFPPGEPPTIQGVPAVYVKRADGKTVPVCLRCMEPLESEAKP